jgi:hypothetical protein
MRARQHGRAVPRLKAIGSFKLRACSWSVDRCGECDPDRERQGKNNIIGTTVDLIVGRANLGKDMSHYSSSGSERIMRYACTPTPRALRSVARGVARRHGDLLDRGL